MLQKWKHIIRNWINCYFNESNQDERAVNIESLLNIISHLHENLNLDESKSSKLEAHTVEEFVLEKYPEFKFENETVEPSNEDDVYLVASLLLFFVCVNSKDVDIKSAMCSKLSGDDQETILKFSKSLLECSPITCRDVRAAITEACGVDMASGNAKVAETPPALRSLHGEVRRLQAALDAERFDRNYLQEELARTNLRMDKLSKDKEQYKLEIVNLKAKISMCCGQEQDSRGAEAEAASSDKLLRQLQEMEERLVRTQELLDDAVYERDTFKTKVEELKQDRDKWLSLSQEESARAIQLAEELDLERRHLQSLKELVAELRQHNRRNGLDSSLLECDDPDASIQSLQQNLSVCSEACANVVEVQLSEEKAKVDALLQQLQRLQEDLNEQNQKSMNEKSNLERQLSERENNILNLKHRINEEIEEKNNLKSYYDDEISKLNNEINELEQKIKDNNDNSRIIIATKMQEIETLQEEKMSLLQSLSNETSKLENIITTVKAEIVSEKQARLNMRDGYENQMMKLNEKILNRNNELVELQNSIFAKGEVIENLQMDLRNEKEISNKYQMNVRQLENNLQDKNEEMTAMQQTLEQNIATVLKEIDHFKHLAAGLQTHCRDLEQCKSELEAEISTQTTRFEELLKETENLKDVFSAESEKLKFDLDEKNAIINTLQTHLHDEIQHKIAFQEEVQKLQANKLHLSEELNKMNVELSKIKIELTGKERSIESLELSLKESKYTIGNLQADNNRLNLEMTKLSNEVDLKNQNIELLNNTLELTKTSLEAEVTEKMAIIENNNLKIADMTAKEQTLQSKIDVMRTEKTNLDHELVEKEKLISQLRADCEKKTKTIEENKKAIRSLDQNMTKEKQKYSALEKNFDTEISKLLAKINETEKTIKELSSSSKKAIKSKEHQILTLTSEVENLKKASDIDKESMTLVYKEKEVLIEKLNEEISFKNKIEKEYQNQCKQLDSITSQLNEELSAKSNEIGTLKMELEMAMKTVEGKCKEIRSLEERLRNEDQLVRDLAHQKTVETKDLQKQINHLQSKNYDLEQEVKREYDCKKQAIEALQKENEQLHFAIEEDNSSHEVILKEKDCIIDRLERQLKVHTDQLESIRKDYENITLTWEIYKVETKENIEAKEEQIKKLTEEVESLEQNISEVKNERDDLTNKIQVISQEMKEAEIKNREEIDRLLEKITEEQTKTAASLKEKEDLQHQLVKEKAAKDSLQTEKKKHIEEIKALVTDQNELLNEKIELTQRFAEEKSVKMLFEEERNTLVSELSTMQRNLSKQVTLTERLLEDKECLTQQLVEEKSAKELAEKEKENLILEKHLTEQKLTEEMNEKIEQLIKKHSLLEQQCVEERNINKMLEEEKSQLLQNLTEQKTSNEVLLKENEIMIAYLNIQIESLENDLLDEKTVREALTTDKEMLLVEKEELLKTLGVEKSAHDEKETEKDQMITKLCEVNKTYMSKANSLQEELKNVSQNMNSLQMENKKQEELNSQITTTLSVALDNLVQELKKKEICNEVLQKLLQSDIPESQAVDKCETLIQIVNALISEVEIKQKLEKEIEQNNNSLAESETVLKEKETQLFELQTEIKRLQQAVNESKIELSKRNETYNTSLENKVRDINVLQEENTTLNNKLNDVKLQLELKVHSLKEKLIDNENLTDKLKSTYECQIDNLNVMITKLSNYLKDKSAELEAARKEKECLVQNVEEASEAIKALEESVKSEVQNQQKILKDFESERQILKNMVTVTESIMEDQKLSLNNIISEHVRAEEILQEKYKTLSEELENERKAYATKLQEKDTSLESLFKDMAELTVEKENIEKEINAQKLAAESEKKKLEEKIQKKESALELIIKELHDEGASPKKINVVADIKKLKSELQTKTEESEKLQEEKNNLATNIQKYKSDIDSMEKQKQELSESETQLRAENVEFKKSLQEVTEANKGLECTLKEKLENIKEMEEKAKLLHEQIHLLEQNNSAFKEEKNALIMANKGIESNICLMESNFNTYSEQIDKLNIENQNLTKVIEDSTNVISNLEQLIKEAQQEKKQLCEEFNNEKANLLNKCAILQEFHDKADVELENRQKEIITLQKELDTSKSRVELCEEESKAKDAIVSKISKEKDTIIASLTMELQEAKAAKDKHEMEVLEKIKIINQLKQNLEEKATTINQLKQNLEELNNEREALNILRKENEELIKVVGQRETFSAAQSQERMSSNKQSGQAEKELRDLRQQVDTSSSDISHSSVESLKTISDLETIILDKNRTITTLQSDVTYLKTLMAESETKLLDVTKELELSKENCHQLSTQLKKIVHQKNEEIAELKRQVSKMSVTENRATQIIKVSAKYQAIILKRIAEIKTNTVLKELTNFGNSNNYDSEVKRSLSAGTVTMEDLENFLETTDRHLRKCSEKQSALQKERDRLAEVNKIHEAEIMDLKKFLDEQSADFKTLSTLRESYVQKLSAVTSLQRTARRDILRLEAHASAACLARLERAHAAGAQDLAECALALERWHARAARRAAARAAGEPPARDAALDVQLAELEASFARLLEQVSRAHDADDARDALAEVRAEYEDKLDRMKSKMKQLYTEQIGVFKEKQRTELAALERELSRARSELAESSRSYEAHIRALTAELWRVGEKLLVQKDEAEWLRRKQRSGSLMSLQHVHSSGLVPFQEEPARPSDSHSLRSLPVNNNGTKREGRAMHMSDEEGEVFDNRWLKELSATPRRESVAPGPRQSGARQSGAPGPRESGPPGLRLSELRWRNSLCPPHLKSSYPAETQFTQAVDEEDIKSVGAPGPGGARAQRKEVGITAYKKPGPPTPSKQAGRLSATDSELRESLRVEAEPQPSRKTSTPSRIRSLFRSNKNDTAEGTPRSRRLSNIFRKK